jgi:putative oxidoreductase
MSEHFSARGTAHRLIGFERRLLHALSQYIPARDGAALLLRLALGVIFVAYGFQKISREGGTSWVPPQLGDVLGAGVQGLIAWTEFLGGIALLLGVLSRVAVIPLAVGQLIAIYLVRLDGSFLQSRLRKPGEPFDYLAVGWVYNFAIFMMCVTVFVLGSGWLSVDHCLRLWWERRQAGRPAAAPAPPPELASPVVTAPPHVATAPAPVPGDRV